MTGDPDGRNTSRRLCRDCRVATSPQDQWFLRQGATYLQHNLACEVQIWSSRCNLAPLGRWYKKNCRSALCFGRAQLAQRSFSQSHESSRLLDSSAKCGTEQAYGPSSPADVAY